MFGSDRRARERLSERGVRAWASVLEIASEGKEVEDDGQAATLLKCRLRVEAADGFPFFFEDKLAFPPLGVPSVGSRIAVVYDPKDHDTLLLDRAGIAPAAAPPAAAGAPAAPAAPVAGMWDVSSPFGVDLGAVMKQVQEARAKAGDDPTALAHELQRRFMGGVPGASFSAATFGAPAEDPLDQLERLADLKAKGILTEEEFQAQKARILGQG
jgi:hypothetical protein